MSEIFRFMSIRSAQLANPSRAIDLSTFLTQPAQTAVASIKLRTSPATRAMPTKRTPAATIKAPVTVKPVQALGYWNVYQTISLGLAISDFNASTTAALVSSAIGKTPIATWAANSNTKYMTDRHDAALALISAHLLPSTDNSLSVLAATVRIMN